jgi:hypothetical protein
VSQRGYAFARVPDHERFDDYSWWCSWLYSTRLSVLRNMCCSRFALPAPARGVLPGGAVTRARRCRSKLQVFTHPGSAKCSLLAPPTAAYVEAPRLLPAPLASGLSEPRVADPARARFDRGKYRTRDPRALGERFDDYSQHKKTSGLEK